MSVGSFLWKGAAVLVWVPCWHSSSVLTPYRELISAACDQIGLQQLQQRRKVWHALTFASKSLSEHSSLSFCFIYSFAPNCRYNVQSGQSVHCPVEWWKYINSYMQIWNDNYRDVKLFPRSSLSTHTLWVPSNEQSCKAEGQWVNI